MHSSSEITETREVRSSTRAGRNNERILALLLACSKYFVVMAVRFQRVLQLVYSVFQHYLGGNSSVAQREPVRVAGRGRLLRRLDDSVSASSVE